MHGYAPCSIAVENDLEIADEEARKVCDSTRHVYGHLVSLSNPLIPFHI
jgi:hypothetical protein